MNLTWNALQTVAPKLSEQFKLALKKKVRTHNELVTRLTRFSMLTQIR